MKLKCPQTGKTCWGEKCVKWDASAGQCRDTLAFQSVEETKKATMAIQKTYDELVASSRIIWQMAIQQVLRDPAIPQEVKDALRQARDAETAERLLRNAGLI